MGYDSDYDTHPYYISDQLLDSETFDLACEFVGLLPSPGADIDPTSLSRLERAEKISKLLMHYALRPGDPGSHHASEEVAELASLDYLEPALFQSGDDDLEIRMQRGSIRDLLVQRLDMDLCARLLGDVGNMARRGVHLLSHVTEIRSERVRAYLSRVAESCIYGLTTEAAVMMRAVLEAALDERLFEVPDVELHASNSGPHSKHGYNLSQKMQFAKNKGWLPEDDGSEDFPSTYAVAIELKEQGDQAVHIAPGLEDMEVSIPGLVRVLQVLQT
jgi:hypothetical protein